MSNETQPQPQELFREIKDLSYQIESVATLMSVSDALEIQRWHPAKIVDHYKSLSLLVADLNRTQRQMINICEESLETANQSKI